MLPEAKPEENIKGLGETKLPVSLKPVIKCLFICKEAIKIHFIIYMIELDDTMR